jgi:hypothetical protein
MATITQTTPAKSTEKQIKEQLTFKRDKDRTLVEGKFTFHEVPGGELEFPVRLHAGDPIVNVKFKDGEICKTTLGVAKHLNTNICYPAYAYKDDAAGRPSISISQFVRRCSFQSLEFLDIEGIAPVGTPVSAIGNV